MSVKTNVVTVELRYNKGSRDLAKYGCYNVVLFHIFNQKPGPDFTITGA